MIQTLHLRNQTKRFYVRRNKHHLQLLTSVQGNQTTSSRSSTKMLHQGGLTTQVWGKQMKMTIIRCANRSFFLVSHSKNYIRNKASKAAVMLSGDIPKFSEVKLKDRPSKISTLIGELTWQHEYDTVANLYKFDLSTVENYRHLWTWTALRN